MTILGFDTATRATAVAVWRGEDATGWRPGGPGGVVLGEARDDPAAGARPRHTTQLMTLIVEQLAHSALAWQQIDLIAVGVGPGTFTGLRVGVATARALATATETPLTGVSTLAALASGAERRANGELAQIDTIVAVLDARRGEVFAAAWPLGTGALTPPTSAPRALTPLQLAAQLGPGMLAVGDGAVEFRPVLKSSGAWIPEDDSELHRVSAVDHCRLASRKQASDPDHVVPEYLRLPDAEINLRAQRNR